MMTLMFMFIWMTFNKMNNLNFNMNLNYSFLITFYFFKNFFYLNYYWSKINYIFGMDKLSFIMILLTFWISILSMFAFNLNKYNKNMFNLLMIYLMIFLMLTFSSMNLMTFFIFFETSLIPIILIIMGWGYQIDRIQASMYMLFYTLFGSIPLLLIIMYMYMNMNTIMMNILFMNPINVNNFYYLIMITTAFLIKMPMYMFHLWLPKAHVEAPVSGSMLLAGIMLKLGSYGLYRFMLMYPKLIMKFNSFLIIISMTGSIITSLICLNQSDLKIIVAYSSVVHMSILLSSMFTMFKLSFKGSLMMMVAHGLCSSGMFFLVNLNYERLKSRNNLINKNLLNIFPSLTMWWFLLCTSNFSAPPSLNLFSEIFMFNSLINWNKLMLILIIMASFFSTCYSIMLYSFSQYGKMNFSFFNFNMINCKEFLMNILHWLPLNMIFINMNLLIYLKNFLMLIKSIL